MPYNDARWQRVGYRDRRRSAALQELGWVTITIVAEDVRYRPRELVRRIETQLDRSKAA